MVVVQLRAVLLTVPALLLVNVVAVQTVATKVQLVAITPVRAAVARPGLAWVLTVAATHRAVSPTQLALFQYMVSAAVRLIPVTKVLRSAITPVRAAVARLGPAKVQTVAATHRAVLLTHLAVHMSSGEPMSECKWTMVRIAPTVVPITPWALALAVITHTTPAMHGGVVMAAMVAVITPTVSAMRV